MTSSTLRVQPGRAAGPAGEETRLWRGMLWVTWRQHRGLLVSVPVAFAVAVTAMLIEGPKINRDVSDFVACHPVTSAACLNLGNLFNTDWHVGNGIRIAVLAAPALLAMFAGPPVVARELEDGTCRYAWTQGIGRLRWTAAKLTFLGSVVTIAALIISQLFAWFFDPFLAPLGISVLSPAVFEAQGVVYATWTLAAFCLGVFLGTLIRRVWPAMAASLGAYLVLIAVTWSYLDSHYPVRTFWPRQAFEAGWLLAVCALLVAGTLWLVRRHAV